MFNFIIVSIFVVGSLLNSVQAYWIRDLAYCPRKREAQRQRLCFKSCFDDNDCRSRYRSCVCDYDCGMSCVKRGVTCPYLMPPEHGIIRYSNGNKFSSRATYECDQGYVLEGAKHRDCQGNQEWGPNDVTSYCTKEVFCSRPPDIINAVNDIPSTINTFHAGYSVKYSCLTGYAGNGTTTSECTFLGQWTFATLKCTPVDCGSPGLLKNGFLSGERFDYPNIIAFFCHEGYELIGKDSTRACQENGLWSGSMPHCQKKTCGSPPIVRFSELIQPDASTNETVQYICQEGYRLNGSSVLKCLQSEWQPIAPRCEPITCVDPQTLFNGSIRLITINDSENFPIDSIVRFSCPTNLTVVGSRRSRCQINGTWSPPIPTCQIPISCRIPSLPHRARYTNLLSTDEWMPDSSSLEYVCGNSRYRQRIFCRQGKILPRLPRCFYGCRVKNGTVSYSKSFYRHREKVDYTCPNSTDEFSLINSTLRCINGNITGEPFCPTSIQTTCIVPHMLFLRNIANTSIPSGTPVGLGSSFTYRCMPDHQPAMDSALVECQVDGKWSHYAQCHPIACKEHPPHIEHGRTVFRSMIHGSIARYRCFPGYQIDVNTTTRLTCQYGQWIPKVLPKCLPIFCPNPGSLLNGRIFVIVNDEQISSQPIRSEFRSNIPTVSHGRTIEFQCLPGYTLHGPSGLTCNHGRWLPVERPRCLIEKHVQPKIIFTG